MAYNLGSMMVGIREVGMKSAQSEVRRTTHALRTMAGIADSVSQRTGMSMDRIEREVRGMSGVVDRSTKRVAASMDRMSVRSRSAFASMRFAIGGFAAYYAGLNLSRSILGTTAAFQRLETSLLAFTGSAKSFNTAWGNIMHLTRNSPAEINEVTKAYQRFMQVGVDVARTNTMMASSLDIASASMLPTGEALERVTKFLQRLLSGFAELQDAELLETAGIPFTKFLMDTYGVGRKGMKDIVGRTGGAQQMAQDFLDYFGSQYDGLAVKMMDKLTGTYARLRNQMQLSFREMGEGMSEPLKHAGTVIEDLLINHKDDLRQLGTYLGEIISDLSEFFRLMTINPERTVAAVKTFFGVMGAWAALGVGGTIVRSLSGIFGFMQGIAGILSGAALSGMGGAATGGLAALFANPAGLAVGITAAAVATGTMAGKMGELKKSYKAITGEELGTGQAAKYMLEDMFDRIRDSIRGASQAFDDFARRMIDRGSGWWNNLLHGNVQGIGGYGAEPRGGAVQGPPEAPKPNEPMTYGGPGLGQSGRHNSVLRMHAIEIPKVVITAADAIEDATLGLAAALRDFQRKQNEVVMREREARIREAGAPRRSRFTAGPTTGRRGHRRWSQYGATVSRYNRRSNLRGGVFGSPMGQQWRPGEESEAQADPSRFMARNEMRGGMFGSPMDQAWRPSVVPEAADPLADPGYALQGIQNAFSDMINNLLGMTQDGTRSIIENLKDVWDSLAKDFGREALQRAIVDPVKDVMDGFLSAMMDSFLGAGGGSGRIGRQMGRSAFQKLGDIISFEGGGYTGRGPRTGGLDGKGMFLAGLHPNERVEDLTKGGGRGMARVSILNLPGQDSRVVSQTRDSNGIEDIVIAVEKRLAEGVVEGGPLQDVLEGYYGLEQGGFREAA